MEKLLIIDGPRPIYSNTSKPRERLWLNNLEQCEAPEFVRCFHEAEAEFISIHRGFPLGGKLDGLQKKFLQGRNFIIFHHVGGWMVKLYWRPE